MILCYLQDESVTAAPFVGRHTVSSRPREREEKKGVRERQRWTDEWIAERREERAPVIGRGGEKRWGYANAGTVDVLGFSLIY